MSLPYSTIVPMSASVSSATATIEKKHMLLAVVNDLIPSSVPFIEFSGASATTDVGSYFGTASKEYAAAQKYFGYLSKSGTAPEKLVVARWYKEEAKAFIKGSKNIASVEDLKKITDGSFKMSLSGKDFEVTELSFSSANSYADVASVIQAVITENSEGGEAYTNATVEFNTTTNGFIITSGDSGKTATIKAITAGETGTDVSGKLGLADGEVSAGADKETFANFCDRLYQANSAGYSITTVEDLTDEDITGSVQWLQQTVGEQTINTVVRLVFNMTDLTTAKATAQALAEKSYTGYVICYDPYLENVNILDCAICASIDFEVAGGAINFNFNPAVGYTSITQLGTVVDYQQGLTNSGLIEDLNANKISCVYSVGFGTQETSFYGFGLMSGAFGTEDVQVNESALEQHIQVAIINALGSLNKIKQQGTDANALVSSIITTPLELFKTNGAIATNGTLTETDKLAVLQATHNPDAVDCIQNNGYYFQIEPISAEDIALRRIRVLICYLCGGVVNKFRIIDRVFGA